MEEEDKYKRAAELLLKGAKMLNIACPVCNDPIYELTDGKLFCSTCQKNIIKSKPIQTNDENEVNMNTHPIIQKKLNDLLLILEDEINLDKITEIVNLLEKLSKLKIVPN
jgi:uncharacterized Zn finger protein (UPF0148 family)